MKKLSIICLALILLLPACEISLYPPRGLSKIFATKTNSHYYENKARLLVADIVAQMEQETFYHPVRKVAVFDLIDHQGRVPELGRFISSKIVSEISKNNYFKVAQRGDLISATNRFHISPDNLDVSSSVELRDALQVEAVITGKIIDLGTNLDISINSIDVNTGEIIASASESLARSSFATEMLQKY